MRAAIYSRKSSDDDHRTKEDKSTAAQISEARKYAAKKGWAISEEHIFVDDGVSGAAFDSSRPGFAKLLASLPSRGQKPAFDILVMSELSRLGRDSHRTPFYCAEILDCGIEIWCYLNDSQESGDSPELRLMTSVRSYSDEAFRVRTSERVRSRLARMAASGHATGGSCFGFRTFAVNGVAVSGEQVRSHSEWRIDEAEAKIIRTIFRMYADGYGFATIAKVLNCDPRRRYRGLSQKYFGGKKVAAPCHGRGSWAASSVREILHRERYTGRLSYGKVQNYWGRGTKSRKPGAKSNIVTVERPDLRIIPADLWKETQARLVSTRKAYLRDAKGTLYGRPGMGTESRYLLSGLGRCWSCAGNMVVAGGLPSKTNYKAIYYYACSNFLRKGVSVCKNKNRLRMEKADALVRDTMRRTALTASAIDKLVKMAEAKLAEARKSEQPEKLVEDLKKAQGQRDNFLALVGEGKAPKSVAQRISELDTVIEGLTQRQATLRTVPSELDQAKMRRVFRESVLEFDKLLNSDVVLARQALKKLLDGQIIFDCSSGIYTLKGKTKVGALLGPKGLYTERAALPAPSL
jgi:site-specific DNA recombinase